MIEWATTAEALRDWIIAESGLGDGNVIWEEKEGARPSGRYISMRISNVRQIGHDWQFYEDAEDPDPGQELIKTRMGFRELTLSLQCFAAKTDPIITAVGTLDKALNGHRDHKTALKEAGVAVLGVEQIQAIDGRVGLAFEPRAVGTVRLSLASNVTGFETYIQSIELTGEVVGADDENPVVGPVVIGELGPLPAPTDLTAEAGDEEVVVAWNTDGSAESFNLYFATSSPVDVETATEIAGVTSPYTHTGRTNGTEYFYAVSAINERLGESALSNEASATPEEPEPEDP